VVTIDTEVDKDPVWRVSKPASFESVVRGVPEILTPLFDEFGVVPTYLLSGEVIEDDDCLEVLRSLDRAELGTHLHGDFVEPGRRLFPSNMAGDPADAVQCQYPAEVELAKLRTLTEMFEAAFGRRPTAFRAGRFGMGPDTLQSLASLGYAVDSSVTPGLVWRYPQATVDFRDWSQEPVRVDTPAGPIVEVPVGVRAGGLAARIAERSPGWVAGAMRRVVGDSATDLWLRPSWGDASGLLRYVREVPGDILVLMFHSVEVTPGASPYAATERDVARIVAGLRRLFEHCEESGISFCGLSEAAELV
jgi:hypothetical protein